MLKLKISDDLKIAMKNKNTDVLSILRVLKGEIERNEQSSSGKVILSDSEIIKIVKKLIDSVKQTTKNVIEISTLEVYIPKQLTESELKVIVGVVRQAGITSVGDFMKYFKTNHEGQYDGKILNNIIKETTP